MRTALYAVLGFAALGASARAAGDQDYPTIERGRYLATEADCLPCHTQPGGKPWAGGRAVETPFGNIVSANITPDPDTGIGNWTDQQFVDALTKGIDDGGNHLYPAMPYTYFTKMTRDDVLAIRAYLATVEPVANPVHSDQLPFPLSVRADMIAWNAMFFKKGVYKPDPNKSAEWNHGAYLVQALGHCGGCHTGKNVAGADEDSKALQGGNLQGWYAPNLTNDNRTGLGRWSVDDVVEYLQTGHNKYAAAGGPMSEVVQYSTAKMQPPDLHAIAVYLKDLPGQGNGPQPLTNLAHGEAIYADECASCHFSNGGGEARLFPSLAQAPSVVQDDPTSLIRVVLAGVRTVGTPGAPTAPGMPAFSWKLSNEDVAAVLTYIRNSWGNAASAVSNSQVSDARKRLGPSATE